MRIVASPGVSGRAAAEMVSGFVKASSHNLKYCGIDALARVVRINPKCAGEHQARSTPWL